MKSSNQKCNIIVFLLFLSFASNFARASEGANASPPTPTSSLISRARQGITRNLPLFCAVSSTLAVCALYFNPSEEAREHLSMALVPVGEHSGLQDRLSCVLGSSVLLLSSFSSVVPFLWSACFNAQNVDAASFSASMSSQSNSLTAANTLPSQSIPRFIPTFLYMQGPIFKPLPNTTKEIAQQQEFVRASVQTATLAGGLSVLTGSPTSAAQGARVALLAKVLACDSAIEFDPQDLSWSEYPLQFSLGESELNTYLGSVVGNVALLTGTAVLVGVAAKIKGKKSLRYPGCLILPVFFLGQATITGATTLLRYGNETERGVGGSVIAASTIPAAATMYLLLTSAFKAVWNGKEWENLEEDFVEKNGFLFEDYRGTRQGYNGVEYLMMLASGVLAAFPNEQCASTAQVAVGINAAYILVMACARPYESKVDGVYFFAISVAQLGSSMCHMYALIKDNDSYQNGAEITAASLGYVMGARTVYDVVVLVKALKKRCSGEGEEGKDQTDLAVPMLLVVPTVVPGPPSSGSNPLGR